MGFLVLWPVAMTAEAISVSQRLCCSWDQCALLWSTTICLAVLPHPYWYSTDESTVNTCNEMAVCQSTEEVTAWSLQGPTNTIPVLAIENSFSETCTSENPFDAISCTETLCVVACGLTAVGSYCVECACSICKSQKPCRGLASPVRPNSTGFTWEFMNQQSWLQSAQVSVQVRSEVRQQLLSLLSTICICDRTNNCGHPLVAAKKVLCNVMYNTRILVYFETYIYVHLAYTIVFLHVIFTLVVLKLIFSA